MQLLHRISTRTLFKGASAVAILSVAYFVFLTPTMTPGNRNVAGESPAERVKLRPNFLLILSDDQSWEHTSFNNYPLVNTPNFDRIAKEGVYFANAYAPAPTCTGSRSAILAGQPVWRLGSASMLLSYYSQQMISYQNILEKAGYRVGFTGKGWDPGRVPAELKTSFPPTGISYNSIEQKEGDNIGSYDLAANFDKFLEDMPPGKPFSFWVGSEEPHRPYKSTANRLAGPKDTEHIPPFLPNTTTVQEHLSGYLEEVEIFDRDVGKILMVLEERGLLESTVVIVGSDNGMPFSRAKTNNYMHGVRVPLSVRWGAIAKPGRQVRDFINLADIAPTLLELAGIDIPKAMTGDSFAYTLSSERTGFINNSRDKTYTAFQRHSGYAREGVKNLTYPRRAIHTEDFVYIKNYFPQRWPAGDPPHYVEAYTYLLKDPQTRQPLQPYHDWATQKRPMEELYDLKLDPAQMRNVAQDPRYARVRRDLAASLKNELIRTEDPLETTGKDVFQKYVYLVPYKPEES